MESKPPELSERMESRVFISHATEDIEFVRALARDLEAQDVDPWLAEQIPPGEDWERKLQEVLEAAAAVVLVISKASAQSTWVRAEVLHALELKKEIIPVVIEQADLPLRWKQLQHLDWPRDSRDPPLHELVLRLPKKSAVVLRQLLETPGQANAIRELIARHSDWLPNDRPCSPNYAYFYRVPMTSGGVLDVFAGRFDTGGPRGYLYYLGSPYSSPFMKSGRPSRELTQILRLASLHFQELRSPLLPDHPLLPAKGLNRQGIKEWATQAEKYSWVHVRILFGRRDHYTDPAHREQVISRWCNENGVDWHSSLEFISYDRLSYSSREWARGLTR